MSSRRGSETDQNPEGSIEARGALRAICELGSSSSEHLSASIAMAPECQGLGCGQSHWARRADRNPHKGVRSRARFWPVGGHGIPVRIDQPSAAIAIPSLGIFDAPESIRRFSISAGLRKTKCRVEITFHRLCRYQVPSSSLLLTIAMVRGRIARFLICNVVGRPPVKGGDVVDCHAGSSPHRLASFSAALLHRLVHQTNINEARARKDLLNLQKSRAPLPTATSRVMLNRRFSRQRAARALSVLSWTPARKPRNSFFLSVAVFFIIPRAQTWNLSDV